MKPSDFKGMKITVMGLGTLGGGVGVVRYLHKHGAKITVTDLRTKSQLSAALKRIPSKNITLVLGNHRQEDFEKADLIIKNPAVPKTSKYLKIAKKNNIPVESDASLFFQLCKAPIVGVTGTKGKTTTVALLSDILKKSGRNVVLAGHNQISVLDRLDLVRKNSIVVFELSSWRLEILGEHKISPAVAIVTNIAEDHLNTYHSMSDYVKAKSNIFSSQTKTDSVILNSNNKFTKKFGSSAKSNKFWFSIKYFAGKNGVFIKNGKVVYRNSGVERNIVDVSSLKILGKHNLENMLAAVMAAKVLGVADRYIKSSLAGFAGLKDRLEFVRKINGKSFYNDTAATIPEATIAALNSFSGKLILIAGGVDKNVSYQKMAAEIKKYSKFTILLPGTATDKLKKHLAIYRVKYIVADTLKSAVLTAYQHEGASEVVLFSPGAASFNMFKNEFDRGDKFREIVRGLK